MTLTFGEKIKDSFAQVLEQDESQSFQPDQISWLLEQLGKVSQNSLIKPRDKRSPRAIKIWMKENKPQFKAAHQDMTLKEVNRAMQKEWEELSLEDKTPWMTRAGEIVPTVAPPAPVRKARSAYQIWKNDPEQTDRLEELKAINPSNSYSNNLTILKQDWENLDEATKGVWEERSEREKTLLELSNPTPIPTLHVSQSDGHIPENTKSRKKSPYMFFKQDPMIIQQVLSENPDANKMELTAAYKLKWKTLGKDGQHPWVEQAQAN